MRKTTDLKNQNGEIKRLMIHNDENGTYLFGYKKVEDSQADWDEFYESEIEALESCETKFGVKSTEWKEIPNPEVNCQHDWIKPVRIKGRENGNPEFGKFEELINGNWVAIKNVV